MNDISALKSGLFDYINIINGIASNFLMNHPSLESDSLIPDDVHTLNQLREKCSFIDNYQQLLSVKDEIIQLEKSIEEQIEEYHKKHLSGRELALLERGYSLDDIVRLNTVSSSQFEEISEAIFKDISRECRSDDHPICIYLGGQPGCGKSSRSMDLKSRHFENNFVEIGIDNYRTFHPNYLEIEKLIRSHWRGRMPSKNDSPGNDIADFTHGFAGTITDLLQEKAAKKRYNILFEWGMRNPDEPLQVMNSLKKLGYENIVDFIAVHKDVSLEACKMRADIMNSQNHIVRRVPDSFHELCIQSLPDSCEVLFQKGYVENPIIDQFSISTRDKQIVWDPTHKESPKDVYFEYLHNPKLSMQMRNHKEMALSSYQVEVKGLQNDEMAEMFQDNETEIEKNVSIQK